MFVEPFGSSVTIIIEPRHRLGQMIYNVVISVNLGHPRISSINIVSDHVVLLLHMYRSRARAGFLSLSNNTIVVTTNVNYLEVLGTKFNLAMNCIIHTAFLAASLVMSYASVVESDIVPCFELFQLMDPPFIMKTYPD